MSPYSDIQDGDANTCLFALFLFCFAFRFSDGNSKEFDCNFKMKRLIIRQRFTGDWLLGKAWTRMKLSKRFRKRMAYTGLKCVMDQYSTLLLAGNVELNPGPANCTRNAKSIAREDIPDFSDILLRLEKTTDDGQESMLQNQSQMVTRLSSIGKNIDTFTMDLETLKEKQSVLEERLDTINETVGINFDHGKDLQFLLGRHEQYSCKSSVRICGVLEQKGKDNIPLPADSLKKESGFDINEKEIDIVQRVGRRQ